MLGNSLQASSRRMQGSMQCHQVSRAHVAHVKPYAAAARRLAVQVQAAKRKEYELVREVLPNQRVQLTVTIPGSVCQRSFAKTVEILRTQVVGELPGFRKDKVPLAIIMEKVGGKKNFDGAVLEELLITALQDVLPAQSDYLPGSENITSNVRDLLKGFDPAQPLTFNITYAAMPPLVWGGNYKDIEVEVTDNGNLETDKAAAEDLIQQYLKDKAQQRVVADRGLQQGDVGIINMKIYPKGSDTPYPGLDKDKFLFDTSADPLGLTQHMLGMMVGEQRKWEFTFPQDWNVELWRGQQAAANVTLVELFSYILPEFDEAFVSRHYHHFSSPEDMRESLVAATTVQRLNALEDTVKDLIVGKVAGCVSSEVPEPYLRMVAEKEFQERLLQLVQKGVARPEDVEEQLTTEELEKYIEEHRVDIVETCKYLLAVDTIAQEQNIVVNEELLETEVQAAAADMGKDFDADNYRQETREKMKNILVMEWLQKNSKVNILPWDGRGSAAATAAAAASALGTASSAASSS